MEAISTEKIPTWALSYILYENANNLTEEEILAVDEYILNIKNIFGEDIEFDFLDEDLEGYDSSDFAEGEYPAYFTSTPAIGIPSHVVDLGIFYI